MKILKEVICIDDQFDTTIDLDGDEVNGNFINPKLHEICLVTFIEHFQGINFYALAGYPEDELYGEPHFADISQLQKEITESLTARNPNIKKYPLKELEEIGYTPYGKPWNPKL